MLGVAALLALLQVEPELLTFGHAHNDYRHPRPLHDALAAYFASVEVDVFLVDGQLLVGHDRAELKPERTLESLYLDPLLERANRFDGAPYYSHNQIWILVDFKTESAPTYAALKRTLARYPELKPAHFRFVVSGNRPVAEILADQGRPAALDGRWGDLGKGYPVDVMPWVSEAWGSHFTWRGTGPMPEAEKTKLAEMVKAVHAEGRKIRFWGAPDIPSIWQAQYEAKVDFINTDNLEGIHRWFHEYRYGRG